jgi:HPt (histidine-containing phosphotransfer) domain-containing protein
MLNTSVRTEYSHIAEVGSPSLVPDQPIDRTHLFKMTLGDHSLEGEVLRLFERQTSMLLGRMAGAEPAQVKALAHTLNGSARGIGAWRVANAAQSVEKAVADSNGIEPALKTLRAAADEALTAIAELLRIH